LEFDLEQDAFSSSSSQARRASEGKRFPSLARRACEEKAFVSNALIHSHPLALAETRNFKDSRHGADGS
jgi:hypothetical protein